jgi:putative hemolysin
MDSTVIEVVIILVLIAANGFFAASEFALISARKSRIKHWAKRGDRRATRTEKLLNQPQRYLAAIQIGITFIATLAGVFGGATIVHWLADLLRDVPLTLIQNAAGGIAVIVTVLGIGILSVVLGELIPKYLALSFPERFALRVTPLIVFFCKAAYLPVQLLTGTSRLILRLVGIKQLPERGQVSEEEIALMVSEGRSKGVFDATEEQLIKAAFEFSDITVRQAMTPRVDIVAVKSDATYEEIFSTITKSGYSRYPVFEETLDRIIGIIYAKDLITLAIHRDVLILKDIVRKPLVVPDSMSLSELLKKFQQRKVHIAMVLDEFGGTAGLITLEDILEEIVGEIQDEHDTEKQEFVAHSDRVAFASGSLRPDELNEAFGLDLPEDIADTIAGIIIDRLGRIPKAMEEVAVHDVGFKVLEMDGSRIRRVKVEKLTKPA